MTRPTFDPKLSLGNVITIVVLIGGLIAGWYANTTQVTLNKNQIERNTASIERLQNERDDTRDRLTKLETQLEIISETLDRIAAAVGAR